MSKQAKGAILSAVVGIICVVLQVAFDIQTGIAGVFIFGVAAGLVIGHEMSRATEKVAPAA